MNNTTVLLFSIQQINYVYTKVDMTVALTT